MYQGPERSGFSITDEQLKLCCSHYLRRPDRPGQEHSWTQQKGSHHHHTVTEFQLKRVVSIPNPNGQRMNQQP